MISVVFGGIGLFLLGMMLVTDGLKVAAGEKLRRIISRFTGGNLSAISSGAVITAILQSSSATTLATIGFVSAGLLTFRQAIGVVFGSNLGTTSTSWIVTLIGLKVDLSIIALPLVGIGILIKIFSGDKYSAIGFTLAGFGLVFVGIDTLQAGMKELAQQIDLSVFSGDSFLNLFVLVIMGVVMTVVMQSSSAAIATTLVALNSGAISLEQSVALVIGQNVGTTVTAALAAIGSTIAAKRTALVHVLFNVGTGILAFFIIPIVIVIVKLLDETTGLKDPVVTLAMFHTCFNLLGLLLFTPFIDRLAAFVIRLLPEKGLVLTRYLDPTVAKIPSVAIEAARRALVDTSVMVLGSIHQLLDEGPSVKMRSDLTTAITALSQVRSFFYLMPSLSVDSMEFRRYLSIIHSTDHLERTVSIILQEGCIEAVRQKDVFTPVTLKIMNGIKYSVDWLQGEGMDKIASVVENVSQNVSQIRKNRRAEILKAIAVGTIEPEAGNQEINGLICLDRLGYHIGRLIFHLEESSVLVRIQQ